MVADIQLASFHFYLSLYHHYRCKNNEIWVIINLHLRRLYENRSVTNVSIVLDSSRSLLFLFDFFTLWALFNCPGWLFFVMRLSCVMHLLSLDICWKFTSIFLESSIVKSPKWLFSRYALIVSYIRKERKHCLCFLLLSSNKDNESAISVLILHLVVWSLKEVCILHREITRVCFIQVNWHSKPKVSNMWVGNNAEL